MCSLSRISSLFSGLSGAQRRQAQLECQRCVACLASTRAVSFEASHCDPLSPALHHIETIFEEALGGGDVSALELMERQTEALVGGPSSSSSPFSSSAGPRRPSAQTVQRFFAAHQTMVSSDSLHLSLNPRAAPKASSNQDL